jgi:DNA-directed RNA polymerase beta' subunit
MKSRFLPSGIITKIIRCSLLLILFGCSDNSDILYITSDDLIIKFSEYKESPLKYKNKVFQITGEIIFKQQAKDNIPFRNKSSVYFGECDNNNNFIWNKTIVCYFDILVNCLFNVGDTVIIQGYLKKIASDGAVIFERCRIIKPLV